MSLVKIKDFKGSLVANEALESINYLGINAIMAAHGYNIDITPIMGKTPRGLIDDSPNIHLLEFERNKIIDKKYYGLSDDEICNIYYNSNEVKPLFIPGKFTSAEQCVWENIDENGNITKWYKHKISVHIKRRENESNSDYQICK